MAEGLPVQVLLHYAAGAELLVLGGSQAAGDGPRPPGRRSRPGGPGLPARGPCPVVAVSPQHVRHLAPDMFRRLVGALS